MPNFFQIIVNHLWFGIDLKTVMERGRIHHQLVPMVVNFEHEFDKEVSTYII